MEGAWAMTPETEDLSQPAGSWERPIGSVGQPLPVGKS